MSRLALLYVIALLSVLVCVEMAGTVSPDVESKNGTKSKGAEMYYTLGSVITAAVVNML